MRKGKEYRLKISGKGVTPDTLPMERLAEYMGNFARMLGEVERVHFVTVEQGSAVLVARSEPQAAPKVERRLVEVGKGIGDATALVARKALDDLLFDDNATGRVVDEKGAVIVEFPGVTRPKPIEYGPFREDAVLEGVVIKLGGIDKSVPVWLKDGDNPPYKCTASVALSKQLSAHYLGALLRVTGSGRWMRDAAGAWQMLAFEIKSFEVLDDTPLADVVKRLQGVKGAEWGDTPVEDLLKLRKGQGLN